MITAPTRASGRGLVTLIITLIASIIVLAGAASPAAAASAAPAFTIDNVATPTAFSTAGSCNGPSNAGVCDTYQVTARDAGSQPTDGSTITLADTLPAGLTVQSISFYWAGAGAIAVGLDQQDLAGFFCSTSPLQCTMPLAIQPDDTLQMLIHVSVDPSASGQLTNTATIIGRGRSERVSDCRQPGQLDPTGVRGGELQQLPCPGRRPARHASRGSPVRADDPDRSQQRPGDGTWRRVKALERRGR